MADAPVESISALLKSRRKGYSLPAGLYTRPDVFEADMDVMFHRHWISVGLECDVPEPGDVLAVDIGRSSIIIARGDDGVLRGFFNVCRHRGARILPPGPGVVGKLVCPYHQWAYELSGELIHAPHMGKSQNTQCYGLLPVHIRAIGGLLFACLSDEPPADIEDVAKALEPRLAPYDLANAKVAWQSDLVEKGNWKLTMENNRECYHCGANHPELCLSFIDLDFGYDPDALTAEDQKLATTHARTYAEQTEAWEKAGYPSAAIDRVVGHETHLRTQRLIIAGNGESQTLDGKPACRKPLGTMRGKGLGDVHLWGNNSWNHFMNDHAVTFMVFPLSAEETLVRTKWLVHKDAVEGVDYDLDHLTSVWQATNAQDAHLVGLAQAGVAGHGYRPGPYSPFSEEHVDRFATWYVERMQAHGY